MYSNNTCDMYTRSLRHIHDPVLLSLKMEYIRFFSQSVYEDCGIVQYIWSH
jgi:hypothetical protein